jgi:hypothetical protein
VRCPAQPQTARSPSPQDLPILSTAGRVYVDRPWLVLGIGVLLIPAGAAIAVLQALVFGGFGLAGIDTAGESAGALVLLVTAIGVAFALLGFVLVQAAMACALVELDAGRPVSPVRAYRLALTRGRPLLGGLGLAVVVWVLLDATAILLPVAIWLAVRWMLLAQAVELEGCSATGGLRRSYQLVGGRWFRVASLTGIGAVVTIAAGPLLGALLIFLTDAPLPLLNLVAGVVYALAMPFVALTTTYLYFDARVRVALAPPEEHTLPAEIEIGGAHQSL